MLEERSREEANTEESLFSLKSPELKPQRAQSQKDLIVVQNQAETVPSILQLEGVVNTLLKEQENLRNKIIDQEKLINDLSKPGSTVKTTERIVSNPAKLSFRNTLILQKFKVKLLKLQILKQFRMKVNLKDDLLVFIQTSVL